jgi:hypothetical protein
MEGGDGYARQKPSFGGQRELSEEQLWLHLWSVARYDLRLTESDFWDTTPRALDGLLARHRLALRREQLLLAQVRADIVNFGFCRPKKAVEIGDLLPPDFFEESASNAERPARMTPRLRGVAARRIRGALGVFLR